VRRTGTEGVKLCSFVLDVAPLTVKIIKIASISLKEEKICYKMVCYALHFGSVNCQKSNFKVKKYRFQSFVLISRKLSKENPPHGCVKTDHC